MGTAIYSRASPADQNPELQLREIQDYADRQGWNMVQPHQYTISGAKPSGPGLDGLMADSHYDVHGARLEASEFPCPRDIRQVVAVDRAIILLSKAVSIAEG